METKIRSWTFNSICSTLIDIDELVCLLLLSWPQPISMQHSIASLRDALTGLLCNSNIVSRRIKPHGPEFVYCPLCAVKCFFLTGNDCHVDIIICLSEVKQMAGLLNSVDRSTQCKVIWRKVCFHRSTLVFGPQPEPYSGQIQYDLFLRGLCEHVDDSSIGTELCDESLSQERVY